MSFTAKIESGRPETQTNPRTSGPRGTRTSRRQRYLRTAIDILETRSLLSTIVGQVINDVTGTGLRASNDNGISGVTIELDQFNSSTGAATQLTTTATDINGVYQFTNLPAGSYLVKEPSATGTFQTAPSAEHVAQSYLVQFTTNNQTAGGTLTAPLPSPPDSNWLASLAPTPPNAPYTFPLAGDFMLQLGPNGTAPTRVFLSGQASVATQAPIVTPVTNGDGTTTTDVTVNTTMTSLQLVGTVSSDQHGQGYLGTITMTLTAPASGQITSRSDSTTLVDSSFNIDATITIPSAFGTPTVLHTSVPINFLAKELSQFPGFGGNYAHNGTTQPISLLDSNNQEQGTLIFGNLAPMPGYDFANFAAATIQGTATIKNSDGTSTALANQPIVFQKVAEVAGPTGEGGSDSGEGSGSGGSGGNGGSNGSGGPPAGMGPAPTTPVTVYTAANGNFSFTGLGPGSYTVKEPNGAPLSLAPANNTGLGSDGETYTISALQSGSTATYNFVNTFDTTNVLNESTAPPSYGTATQTIIPGLNIGGTAYANNGGPSYVNDGVTFGSTLFPGATEVPLTITVVVPQGDTAYLSGWLDAVHNGSFGDTGGSNPSDLIQYNTGTSSSPSYASLDNYVITAGVHTLTFNIQVPSDAVAAATFARFRLTDATAMNTGPTGTGGNGEVEDIPVTIYDQAQLATITGQTFEDTNGTGVIATGNTGQDNWIVSLVNLDTGQTVATQTSAPQDTTLNGQPVSEHGIYEFLNVVPGHYQVIATPPAITGLPTPIVTAPASSEGATSYQLNVQAGQHYGAIPSGTTIPTSAGLGNVTQPNDTLLTLAQFMIVQGSGGHGGSGSTGGSGGSGSTGAGSTSQPIRISVIGDMKVAYNGVNSSGLLQSAIETMTLTGLAVSQSEEGGPASVLGPVTVTLGMFDSTGTIGPSSSGETTGDVASYAMYIKLDLSAFHYGVMVNTRPLNVSGTVTQIPFYDTILKRSGGGSPIPLRDESNGTEPLQLVSATFTTMYGLDQGGFYPGTIGGTVYKDTNGNNQVDTGEGGLAGATVMVTQVSTEGPSSEEGGGEGSGNGGNGSGGSGSGESTPPPVYITQTDAQGNWSITNLGPGTYTVTEVPPHAYGISGAVSTITTVPLTSRGQLAGNNFLNYPINQRPVIAGPGGIKGMEDHNLPFSPGAGNGISISDEDAGTNPVQVSLSTPDGTLNLPETTGLTLTQGGATGSSTIVATGTIDAINAALAGLTLSPTAHFNGSGSLTISVDDMGNSGVGGPQTATTTIPLDITAVADAPTLNVGNAHGSASNQIPLGISVARGNGANSETLMVMVSGVPAGAVLTGGTDLGNGQWQLTPQQLTGLAIVSPNSGTYPLTVTATATEPSNGSTATTVLPLSVTVDNVIPQIYSAGDQKATVGDPTAINLGSFYDTPTDGAWNVKVNWGDTTSAAFTEAATGQLGTVPHTYAQSGRFTVTVTVQDKNGGASSSQFLVTVGPTEVAQVAIGNGTAQRSMIRSLTVTFSGPVNILPGAFTLRDKQGRTVKLNVATSLVNGQTVATLTFKGQRIVGGSLWDGTFTLSIDGSHILDATTGQATDAAINGLAGSQAKVQFRRRFGDINGDGVVTSYDMQQFRKALNSRAGQSRYVSSFDYNSNNLIAGGDLLQIRQRLQDYLRTQDQIKKQDRLNTK